MSIITQKEQKNTRRKWVKNTFAQQEMYLEQGGIKVKTDFCFAYLFEKKSAGEINDYHIDEEGNVDVLGLMPNTNDVGWYYLGNIYSNDFVGQAEYFLSR